jgi:alkanesulfonate monooxygenase SsuD/methylene tetrahydromethanopterin reductase-like flavin-dependent oxidoreductase (luciferase family)
MKTTKIDLMTSIAVAFARNPMSLAYLGNDLQLLSKGRFIMGLGTQVKSHVEHRYSMPWGKPVSRMCEIVLARLPTVISYTPFTVPDLLTSCHCPTCSAIWI